MFDDMQFAIITPPDARLDTARAWWRETETLGFDAIGVPDTPLMMRDAFVSLAAVALDTARIRLMLTVTNVLTRDASVMAGSFLGLEDLAPGRISFGFGAGDSATYGTGLGGSRLAAMETYIQAVRAILAGKEVAYEGRELHGAWRDWQPHAPRILVAANGERSLRMAGRVGDAVISGFGLLPETVARARELVDEGAREAGRDPGDIELWNTAVVSPGETVEEGFLHSAMGGAWMLARNGFAGKLVPQQHHAALLEMAETFSLETHSRANEAALEVAKRSGCMEYLVARQGGMIGPVDYAAAVERIRDAGARNLIFVALGADKMRVARALSEAVLARRDR